MFNCKNDCYNYILKVLSSNLPDYWALAWFEVKVYESERSVEITPFLLDDPHMPCPRYFDLLAEGGEHIGDAFYCLSQFDDEPWNKCRFFLHTDGSVKFEKKFDKDFDWLQSASPSEVAQTKRGLLDAIKSWRGVSGK